MSLIFFCEIGVEEHKQCVYHTEGIAGFDGNRNERKRGKRMEVGEQYAE